MERKQRAQSTAGAAGAVGSAGSAGPAGVAGPAAAGAKQPEKGKPAPVKSETGAAKAPGKGKTAGGRRVIDLDHADEYDAAKAAPASGTAQDGSAGFKGPRRYIERAVIEVTKLTTVDSDSLKVTRPIMSLPRVHLKARFLGFRKKK